ncbi:uncharacterized protein PHACADRAFT_213473 [Phanerochaete carnosa HHB-10118-sp]|uniref:SET domain-containing protein n=1 Tax=Phanerochaete carnosa (strain HHB-10118-sp) TaxID=650164 RepID=K5VH54_PHACS|nr:uncharacterized protein PHACADRAFT_213473 [Phanerochaete carnosa HHB-10118-sp]EKM50558.1 hypothetical protein PHACADRAFT_213473 [Phanerochaete carnosa HHB-10118-sp]
MASFSINNAESAKLKAGPRLILWLDYEGAVKCYTDAIRLDASDPNYPLNRCFAYLRLGRWIDAEHDATAVLTLDDHNLKALYRRSLARKEWKDFTGARADLLAFADAGGDMKTVIEENIKLATAEANAVMLAADTPACGVRMAPSEGCGIGIFATRPFCCGDLIVVEKPLYTVKNRTHKNIMEEIENLNDDEHFQMMQLHNNSPESFPTPFIGIHHTNTFGIDKGSSVLCLRISRFNHSCSLNTRFAWHAKTNTARVFALRPIAVGEEIFHWYRKPYKSTRTQRQELLSDFKFVCTCSACTLPEDQQAASDSRRKEIGRLWEVSFDIPLSQAVWRVQTDTRVVHLLCSEGIADETDLFTVNAAIMCAYHGDWESAKYWALDTYKAHVHQFGADCHERTTTELMWQLLCNPRGLEGAGKGKRKIISTRL